jgi:hypothetical protein
VQPVPAIFVALLVGSTLAPGSAGAQDGDGLYGRFDGDTTLSLGAGGGLVLGQEEGAAAVLEVRARYLDAGGLVLAPELRPSGASRLIVGVDVRPLFPARFLTGGFSGVEVLDLTLESVGIELAAAVTAAEGRAGVALAVGFGFEVPIVPPSVWARGLWLRLAARHARSDQADRVGPQPPVADWVLLALLNVRALVDLGIAAREPPRYEVR